MKFLCVWLRYYVYVTEQFSQLANGGAKIEIKSYIMRSFFCLGVFSGSVVFGKITAACWSWEEERKL